MQRFRSGQIDIIVNVDIFSEGFDCPDIEFIQLARPTKSLVKYLQQVGRGLRPTSGKGKCIILDNVGSHIEFSLPNADRNWEAEFVGETIHRKRSSSSTKHVNIEYKERNFEEGTDDLLLIDDVAGFTPEEVKGYVWKEEDDMLLKTLYIDRQCSLNVITSVFNLDESLIRERLIKLKLVQ